MSNGTPSESAGPENAGNDAVVAAYETAKQNYIRAVVQDAEVRLRDAFAKRREALTAEINDLRDLAKMRQDAANAATARYAMELPHRVRKSGVRPPSIVERLRSLNAVDAAYREAVKAANELDDVNEMLRKRRDRLDAIEREARRSLYLREEAVRKKLQTPEGLAALHDDPMVRTAFLRMQNAATNRAKFDERSKRGEVPPEEERDRDMQARGLAFAQVPLQATIITRIVRYGPLEYYVLRDLSKRESLLSCDPALEPLRAYVFDLTVSPSGYEAALRHTAAEEPMSVLDHLKASYLPSEAIDAFERHTDRLKTDVPAGVTPPRDTTEAEMIAMLTLLARAVANYA